MFCKTWILENSNVKKVIGIYPGRFQPAGVHHYKTYKWLDGKFDKAYVATSNKTDSTKSPLNFKKYYYLNPMKKNVTDKIIEIRKSKCICECICMFVCICVSVCVCI